MLRSALVSLLNARRNNDVYVLVPIDGQPPVRLPVQGVLHDPSGDVMLIRAGALWFGRPAEDDEPDPPVIRRTDDLDDPDVGVEPVQITTVRFVPDPRCPQQQVLHDPHPFDTPFGVVNCRGRRPIEEG